MCLIYVGLPSNATAWLRQMHADFVAELDGRLDVRLFDHARPAAGQFDGVTVVVEAGGSFADRPMIDEAARHDIRLWQVVGTGLDHVDLDYFQLKGIPVANLPGEFSSVALAEHAAFGMLFFAKHYRESQDAVRGRVMCDPVNDELHGQTLGLVGFGASGRELARRMAAFGMRLLAIDARPLPDPLPAGVTLAFFGSPSDIEVVLQESDYVSIHVPLTPDTRHLIGDAALRLMKQSAVLINLARGEIVDEPALLAALTEGRIRGAALDVFAHEPVDPTHPLLRLPNVYVSPHSAGVTTGTSRRRGAAAASNAIRASSGETPLYLVPGACRRGTAPDDQGQPA